VKCSPGCAHCYARELDNRYHAIENHWGLHARRRFMSESYWKGPLKWNRAAEAAGEKHRVFCASMGDVMEVLPTSHPDAVAMERTRQRLWSLIVDTQNLIWLLLTKRPENLYTHFPVAYEDGEVWQPNVWLGVTAENQEQADKRIPLLQATPAARRFVSCEPLLEELTLVPYLHASGSYPCDETPIEDQPPPLDWVIVGAESGSKARPMDYHWARELRDQCIEAGQSFFYKQAIVYGKKVEMPELDGRVWDEVPTC
jgi:protein gp37